MKKLTAICLVLILLFSLFSCSSGDDSVTTTLDESIFNGEWFNKNTATLTERDENSHGHFSDTVKITEIYRNCFFAKCVIGEYRNIIFKVNTTSETEFCVGDEVYVEYDRLYLEENSSRAEVDALSVTAPQLAAKPVIYLYPEKVTDISVKLNYKGKLTCTYPTYNDGCEVTASPDGTLTDKEGKTYNYLYWEGVSTTEWNMSKGFCVRGEDTAVFLEDALASLGLNRREANEFIVYWLPIMQDNPYNIIAFQAELYADTAGLEILPAPDTLIRVFMAFKPSETKILLTPQELSSPPRTGFTVVEWGGCEMK